MTEQPLGVVIINQNTDGRILVGKRKNSYKAGWYGLPGGRIEAGEKIEVAAGRELAEETGIEPLKLEYLGFIKELQDGFDFIHFVFKCTEWSGIHHLIEPEKCEGWEWFTAEELQTLKLLPGHQEALKLLKTPLPFLEI